MTTCSDCGGVIGRRNKSGRCRTCSSRAVCRQITNDPACAAKRRETVSKWTDEYKRAKVAHLLNRDIPPDEMRRRQEQGMRLVVTALASPEAQARRHAKRFQAGAKRTATVLGWCPPDRRDEYRRLINSKRMKAADAKAYIISTDIEHGKRLVQQNMEAMRRKHDRDLRQAY